jgi:tetratricopeptide (TPR) repeat protein
MKNNKMSRDKSKILVQKAYELNEEDEDKAIQIYHNIIDVDSSWSVPYYNLGLIYKYKSQWEKSYEFNLKATELNVQDEAAWWNLGIACTALKKWRAARIAWNKFGLELDINDTEVSIDLGAAPIRLLNDEVVWTTRVCPARAYIENVPLEESGYRYNDLVLIDGSPTGTTILDGVEYSVFDELEVLEESGYQTYSIGVEVDDSDEITALEDMCYDLNYGFENWTDSVKILCKQCSEGVPHEDHDNELESNTDVYNLAIATNMLEELENVLEEWMLKNNAVVNWIE